MSRFVRACAASRADEHFCVRHRHPDATSHRSGWSGEVPVRKPVPAELSDHLVTLLSERNRGVL